MYININHKPKSVSFTISGRSTGGTAKTEHLIKAYKTYVNEFKVSNYVTIVIYLEDGAVKLNKSTAKRIIHGYKKAAKDLENFVSSQGITSFKLNLQFVKV